MYEFQVCLMNEIGGADFGLPRHPGPSFDGRTACGSHVTFHNRSGRNPHGMSLQTHASRMHADDPPA